MASTAPGASGASLSAAVRMVAAPLVLHQLLVDLAEVETEARIGARLGVRCRAADRGRARRRSSGAPAPRSAPRWVERLLHVGVQGVTRSGHRGSRARSHTEAGRVGARRRRQRAAKASATMCKRLFIVHPRAAIFSPACSPSSRDPLGRRRRRRRGEIRFPTAARPRSARPAPSSIARSACSSALRAHHLQRRAHAIVHHRLETERTGARRAARRPSVASVRARPVPSGSAPGPRPSPALTIERQRQRRHRRGLHLFLRASQQLAETRHRLVDPRRTSRHRGETGLEEHRPARRQRQRRRPRQERGIGKRAPRSILPASARARDAASNVRHVAERARIDLPRTSERLLRLLRPAQRHQRTPRATPDGAA